MGVVLPEPSASLDVGTVLLFSLLLISLSSSCRVGGAAVVDASSLLSPLLLLLDSDIGSVEATSFVSFLSGSL